MKSLLSKKNLLEWVDSHGYIMLMASLLSLFIGNVNPLLISGICSFGILIYWNRTFLGAMKPFGGWANIVSFLRLLILIFCCLSYKAIDPTLIFIILMITLLMDLLDGYLAKKYDTVSKFGMYFDMEIDAFYVLLLTFILYFNGYMPSWILFIGLLRYLNTLAKKFVFTKAIMEKKLNAAAYIAGLVFVVLPSPFILERALYYPIILGSSILLVFSFAYGFSSYFEKNKEI